MNIQEIYFATKQTVFNWLPPWANELTKIPVPAATNFLSIPASSNAQTTRT
jgi:hypothetical protein